MDKEFLRTVLLALKECYPGKSYDVYDMADEKKMLRLMFWGCSPLFD